MGTRAYKIPASRTAWWISAILFWGMLVLFWNFDAEIWLEGLGAACVVCLVVRHGRAHALGTLMLSIISLLLPAIWLGLILWVPVRRPPEWMLWVWAVLLIPLFVNGVINAFVKGKVPVRVPFISWMSPFLLGLLIGAWLHLAVVHVTAESPGPPHAQEDANGGS